MERLVLDTNIIVSAFLWGGKPQLIITTLIEKGGILLSSRELLEELEQTLTKPKLQKVIGLSGKTSAELVAEFSRISQIVEPAPIPNDAVRDPKDVKVLACAVGGQASYIVTGDEDLLVLKTYATISIVTAAEMLNLLQTPE